MSDFKDSGSRYGTPRQPWVMAGLAAAWLCIPGALWADANTYVHASDPSCLGNSPCFNLTSTAIQNTDNGGTVTILSDVPGAVTSTFGKQNITIQGSPATVEHDSQFFIQEFVTGWTIRDLVVTAPIRIRDVVGSLTLDNVTANTITIGELTVDTTADITLRNVKVPLGGVNIIGAEGSSLAGSVLVEDSDVLAANVVLHVAPGPATNLDADVTFRRTTVDTISGVRLDGTRAAGVGNMNGNVLFDDVTCLVPQTKLGVITFGDITGDLAGDITMINNDCLWLAALTTGSISGNLGKITMNDNRVEVLEIVGNGGGLQGPLEMKRNTVVEQGDVTEIDFLLVLVDAAFFSEDVVIEDNSAGEAETAVRTRNGDFSKLVSIARNSFAFLDLDVQGGGDYVQPPQVIDNFLPTSDFGQYSVITVRNRDGGDIPGAVITGNTADALRFTAFGPISGPVDISGNLTREEITVNGSNLGMGRLTVAGNVFQGTQLFSGVNADVNFNNISGMFTITNGTNATAPLNWWGCDEGPDNAGCATLNNQQFNFAPWLTFGAGADCALDSASVLYNVTTTSAGTQPAGNLTPGTVTVNTNDGTVLTSPTVMTQGMGAAMVQLNNGVTMPSFTVTLGSETRNLSASCSDSIFADGFESGDTLAWD